MSRYEVGFKERLCSALKKTSLAMRIFGVVAILFALIGLCTLGSATTCGDAYNATLGNGNQNEIIFKLDYTDTQRYVTDICVNFGTVYTDAGSEFEVKLEYRSANSSATAWSTSSFGLTSTQGKVYVPNMYGVTSTGRAKLSGANYNWAKILQNKKISYSAIGFIKMTVYNEMEINEVAVLAGDGTNASLPVALTVQSATNTDQKSALTDAAGSYVFSDTTYYNFTENELYTLSSINGLAIGSDFNAANEYNVGVLGGLSVLIMGLGVAIFGFSPFGLRFFPMLFNVGLLILIFIVARKLFKNDWLALASALLYAFGGLSVSLATLGAEYVICAFFSILSYLFMIKAYTGDASQTFEKKHLFNLLYSGIFAACAIGASAKAVFTLVGVMIIFVLFVWKSINAWRGKVEGVVKQTEELNANEKNQAKREENEAEGEKQIAAEAAKFSSFQTKIWVMLICSFILIPIALVVLFYSPMYTSYLRAYYDGNAASNSLLKVIFTRLRVDAVSVDYVSFTSFNASSAFGWFIGYKGATLYNASSVTSSVVSYLSLNAQPSIIMTLISFVAFVFTTVFIIVFAFDKTRKANDKQRYMNFVRIYACLGIGLLFAIFPYLFIKQASVADSLTFNIFFTMFIPFAVYIFAAFDKSGKRYALFGNEVVFSKTVIASIIIVAIAAVSFVMALPMLYCFETTKSVADGFFGWFTIQNNGFFRYVAAA